MVRTQIQLTDEQAKEIRRIARTRLTSVAEIIREAVNNVIRSGTGVATDVEDQRRRALNAVGNSVPGNVTSPGSMTNTFRGCSGSDSICRHFSIVCPP
jgi:hypothetical protein